MFPYDYILSNSIEKSTNQSSVVFDCNVHDDDSLYSSCLFTFGFYYVLPLTIIGVCYSRVSCHVRRSRYKMAKHLVNSFFVY